MLTGFENVTYNLTDYEKSLIPILVNGFKKHFVGKNKAVKSRYIVSKLKSKGYNMSGVRLRKLIHVIRVEALIPHLVSDSNGYYIATKVEEVQKCIESLKQREDRIAKVRKSLERELMRVTTEAA